MYHAYTNSIKIINCREYRISNILWWVRKNKRYSYETKNQNYASFVLLRRFLLFLASENKINRTFRIASIPLLSQIFILLHHYYIIIQKVRYPYSTTPISKSILWKDQSSPFSTTIVTVHVYQWRGPTLWALCKSKLLFSLYESRTRCIIKF